MLGVDIQEQLNKADPVKYTHLEEKLLELREKNPKALDAKFAAYRSRKRADEVDQSKEDITTGKQLRVYERMVDKIARIDSVYSDMFLLSSYEKMQKLIFLKRQGLQTILSLERELERRKSDAAPG